MLWRRNHTSNAGSAAIEAQRIQASTGVASDSSASSARCGTSAQASSERTKKRSEVGRAGRWGLQPGNLRRRTTWQPGAEADASLLRRRSPVGDSASCQLYTMEVPLVVAGSAAYLYAKTQFGHDALQAYSLIYGTLKAIQAEKNDKLNLFYTLENHAKSRKGAHVPFIAFEGKEWTYKEAYDTVLQYAAWVKSRHSIAPGEVVAMDMMNSAQFVFLQMAIWSLGAAPAYINYNLTGDPLLHCLRTSTARVVIVDEELRSQFSQEVIEKVTSHEFRDGQGSMDVVFFDADVQREIGSTKGVREPDEVRSGAKKHGMSSLIYTSGTTGLPKPGIIAWGKSVIGGTFCSKWLGLKRSDRFYTCMPLYHSTANTLGLCLCLNAGCTLIVGRKFSTRNFWNDVRSQNATVIQYVGETLRYLLSAPPQTDSKTGENLDRKHNVRIAFGNGLRPDVWNRFKDRFGVDTIAEFYGATEAPSASWNISNNDFSRGAIGRNGPITGFLLSYTTAIVEVDWATEAPVRTGPDNFCKRVARGEPGELLQRVDAADIGNKFQGYFNNKKASASKLMRDVFVKGDAYFRTGDVVRWDKEGRWWFMDRIGDTFRWKSENVSTAEVSEALGTHPSVHEANVYGVEIPHHDGRAGCAAMVLGREVDQGLLDSIATLALKALPRYAVPVFIRIPKDMGRTGTNKQQKHLLKVQGVEPGADRVFWLQGGTYLEMGDTERQQLQAGRARL